MDYPNEHEQDKDPRNVVIHDLRHSRADQAGAASAEEPEPEIPASDEAPEPAGSPAADAQQGGPAATERQPEPDGSGAEDLPPDTTGAGDQERLEFEQMKMIFEMGLKGYLSGQLAILINFALIHLGRAANPATGLVATDLDGARIAIDVLEKINSYIAGELQPAEQENLKKLVADLKYSYVQAVGGGAAGIKQ